MTTLVLEDFNPRHIVTGNKRIHRMVRAELCAMWRKLAHDVAVDAYGYADVGQAWHEYVRIVLTVRYPNGHGIKDPANLYPYVAKPIVDGLVDARVIANDDYRHVIGPDMRRDLEVGPHRIVVEIEDLPVGAVA